MHDLNDYRWLIASAQRWLTRCREETTTASLIAKLRQDVGAARAALVVEQVELRRRARGKFARADEMFFTEKGLMQASGDDVARYKATRFPAAGRVADLCCGIGGDLLALAARADAAAEDASEELATARGVERDAWVALLAEANARLVGDRRASVEVGDAATFDVASCAAWHLDPDRRASGRRTTQIDQYSPDLAALERMTVVNDAAAVKLAPATAALQRWRREAELEWIGARGECKQQVAWFGRLARLAGRRTAVIVDRTGAPLRTVVGRNGEDTSGEGRLESRSDATDAVRRFLFEPHAAVLAAGLAAALADEYGLAPLTAGGGYLTGDAPLADPALAAFEVQDVLPLDTRRLKRYLREAKIGRLEVKKRGLDVDPHRLQRQLEGRGERRATLLVARVGRSVRAIVARRVAPQTGGPP